MDKKKLSKIKDSENIVDVRKFRNTNANFASFAQEMAKELNKIDKDSEFVQTGQNTWAFQKKNKDRETALKRRQMRRAKP